MLKAGYHGMKVPQFNSEQILLILLLGAAVIGVTLWRMMFIYDA